MRGLIRRFPSIKSIKKLRVEGGSDLEYYRGKLCLIDHGGTFRILDPVRPEEPIAVMTGLGNLRQIEISEVSGRTIAAITARENGLWIIDMTVPASPFVTCHYDSVELATGVTFSGKYLFIGCRSFGVEVMDISDPDNPRHITSIRAGEVQSLKVANGILYTGSWGEREVNVIDVSDLNSPRTLSKIEIDGRTDGICIHGNLLLASFGQHLRPATGLSPDEYGYGRGNGFSIYDISDPTSPTKLSRTLFAHRYYCVDRDMWDVTVSSHYAIVSHTFNGVWIYDISDPKKPELVDYVGITTDKKLEGMITLNDFIMTNRPPIIPFDYEKISYATVEGVALGEGKLWIASDFSELVEAGGDYFVSESPRESAELTERGDGFYSLHPGENIPGDTFFKENIGQVHAITELCGRLYAACGNDGIRCFDKELHELYSYPVKPFVRDVRAYNGRLYVAAGDTGILILEPDADGLKLIGHFSDPKATFAAAIPSGRFIMAHADDQRLFIIDASNPADMKLVMTERYSPGLIYYRQMTENGSGGRYFGCWWNANLTHWYDLSGDEPIKLKNTQGRLNYRSGATGLNTGNPDEYKALVVCGGGYVIHDIRENLDYTKVKPIRIPGVKLAGKPIVSGNILAVADRIDGDVTICDISDPTSPKLLFRAKFNGHPDIVHISGGRAYIPLGHQGICVIRLKADRCEA